MLKRMLFHHLIVLLIVNCRLQPNYNSFKIYHKDSTDIVILWVDIIFPDIKDQNINFPSHPPETSTDEDKQSKQWISSWYDNLVYTVWPTSFLIGIETVYPKFTINRVRLYHYYGRINIDDNLKQQLLFDLILFLFGGQISLYILGKTLLLVG